MNRKLTAIALSAAIAGGIGAAAVPATGAFADGHPSTASQSSRPTPEQAKQQLIDQAGTSRVSVVDGVGYSGDQIYFGAVVTGHDTVAFYANPGDGWTKTSEKSILDTPFGDDVQVRGSNVTGVQYPVFVLEGTFTGNRTGQAVAFGHDAARGWGVFVGKGDQLLPSGHGISELGEPGLELNVSISDGMVVSHSLWGPDHDESNGEQIADPIIRVWKGAGRDALTMQSERGGPFD